MGAPNYTILLKAEKDYVLKSYLSKNEMDGLDAENPEELEKFASAFEGYLKFTEAVKTHALSTGKTVDVKELQAGGQITQLYQDVSYIYKKRVLLVRDFVTPRKTYLLLASFASRYGIFLASVPCLIKKAAGDPDFSKEIEH